MIYKLFFMRNINYFNVLKFLALLVIVIELNMACAVRLKPAYLTGISFARQPASPAIVAVPVNTMTTPTTAQELRYTLDAVFFEVDQATLLPEGKRKIEEFSRIIQQYGSRTVLIEGHTDNTGDKAYNQSLSERRAKAVRDILVAQGISSSRLITKGFGETRPVSSNATKQGRQQNRRVEIVILNEGENPAI
jgi:outer membrane protein OmpA-like peptidoglycan-associated protein